MSTYEIVLAVSFGLLVTLAAHAIVLHARAKRQAANIAQLNDVIHRMTREQVKSTASVYRLERALDGQNERLEAVDTRSIGTQRIESAVRVARQGAANEAILRDLGLSDAEASLLLRLHNLTPEDKPGEFELPTQAASLADMLAQARENELQEALA